MKPTPFARLLISARAAGAKRDPKAWTLRGCAKRGGLSGPEMLRRWESGVHLPREPYLAKCARAYRLTVDDVRAALGKSSH